MGRIAAIRPNAPGARERQLDIQHLHARVVGPSNWWLCSLLDFVVLLGTDDTSVKVLDVKLPFARTGRIWPYCGDAAHPVILYDYTATRERAGPEKFLKGYRGYLQADAYGGYDAFFKDPARGLTEVGCWAHARRYFIKRWSRISPAWDGRCC